jgi:hypothetical protein
MKFNSPDSTLSRNRFSFQQIQSASARPPTASHYSEPASTSDGDWPEDFTKPLPLGTHAYCTLILHQMA